MLWHQLLRSASFHQRLLDLDQELAAQAAGLGCAACGKDLHVANYPRKPRRGLVEAESGTEIRYSVTASAARAGTAAGG